MRTLRRARSPHFSSDLTLRSLFGDRAADAEEGTFSSLTEEGAHRSLPEEAFNETASDDSDSPNASSALQMNVQGLSYSSLSKSVTRHRSLSPWHGGVRQNALAMKHQSLGATPLAAAAIPASPRKYHDAMESAFASKHRSLDNLAREEFYKPVLPPRVGLRHRSLGGGRERSAIQGQHRSSVTPSFLEGLAERVRSASPTPKSLSSDPEKIIASLPTSPRQGSFSASGSRLPSTLGSEGQSVPSVRTNSSVFGRGSRMGSQIPHSEYDFDQPGAQSNTSLRHSTSLRRVLSLGRSRADSDLQSVLSEPGVYTTSAHIADDIWIAPKDLYSIERRVALKQYKKSKAAHNGRRREDQLALLAKNAVAEQEKKEGTSETTTTESETRSDEDVEEEVVEDDESSGMRNSKKIGTGPADMNHAETSLSNSDQAKPDPFEYGGKSDLHDMSSRLIRLFFSSGSQNPIPPSAARAAEMRNQHGSSRSLFFWRNPDRMRTNLHQQRGMTGNLAGSTSMQNSRSENSNFGGYEVPPSEHVYEFDFRAKVRELSRFANVRAWIRRRAYRRSQRRPERRPREAQT